MKSIIALLVLSTYGMYSHSNNILFNFITIISITVVFADPKADIDCVNNRNKELDGKSDQELFDITQENLKIGQEMVNKRVKTAADNGFPCYQQFYDIYVGGLVEVLQDGEKERLDMAKTPEEKTEATKLIAGITEAMRCDEDWRAENLDKLIKDAKCDGLESFGVLDLAKFKPKLLALETGLTAGKLGLGLKNSVMSGVVGEVSFNYFPLCSYSNNRLLD